MHTQVGTRRLIGGVGLALCVGVFAWACCPKVESAPQPAQGCPKGRPPQNEGELRACLQNVRFDSGYEVSDSQPLTIIDSTAGAPGMACPGDSKGSRLRCRYGPLAKIEPVIGGQQYSDAELMEGRIVAKLWIPGTETEKYPKYNLSPGDSTYWWVRTDSTRQGGISVFILQTGRVVMPSDSLPLHREPYREANLKGSGLDYKVSKYWRAAARWIWSLIDETAKVKCGSGSCS
jgi:hypothetical protein